jgi:SAM-dependent methyltransferase
MISFDRRFQWKGRAVHARVGRIMSELENARGLNETGKIILDDIYNASDPSSYYLTLGRLDYVIPMAARAVFIAIIDALRAARALDRVKVADIGCSYGVNAAILKYDIGFAELTARYAAKRAEGLSGERLLCDDRAMFASLEEARPIDVIGLDTAESAIAYAESARIIDAGLVRNLDLAPLDALACGLLGDVDLVISTGAVGYVGPPTFARVIEAAGDTPWVAAFVLRQFDFAAIAAALAKRGYRTETLTGVAFPQRRFAGADERAAAFERLRCIGRRPTALEHSGWYASTLHVARPEADAVRSPLERLFARTPIAAAEVC